MGALAGLLPNVRGPSIQARRLFYGVWESLVLYASPVWAGSVEAGANDQRLRRAQKAALVRVTTAYRTVAFQALCVLAGQMPAKLKVLMWADVFKYKAAIRADPGGAPSTEGITARVNERREAALASTMEAWQEMWSTYDQNNWTRRIVPLVTTFVGERGLKCQLDYWTMQLLTSHGSFAMFRVRMGKSEVGSCPDCGAPCDNAEHVLFECPELQYLRDRLVEALGSPIRVENFIDLATADRDKWTAFREFAFTVMRELW